MRTLLIIPARMGSSRFPGKPLAMISGVSMIERVYRNACESAVVDSVWIATCDNEIAESVHDFGGKAIMTSSSHQRASDRCAEALVGIEELEGEFQVVCMLQGDEPLITGQMITESVTPLINGKDVDVVNLIAPIKSDFEFNSPNTIKVVCDQNRNALFMTRQPIPSDYKFSDFPVVGKQVCAISFTREFLKQYQEMSETPLEIIESIDMLRIMEHGFSVFTVPVFDQTHAVDCEADIATVEAMLPI